MADPLLVTARLASPLAGGAPQLDGLMEWLLSLYHREGVPGHKVDRSLPAPPLADIPIPIPRRRLGPWPVAACSDPILAAPSSDSVEHINKRFAAEEAALLAPGERRVVATTNGPLKSYRLPLRVRTPPAPGAAAVAWFAVGDRREVHKLLRRVRALGKKRSVGYAAVREWSVERCDADYSWFAPSDAGPVLMRTLPLGPWLPDNLVGARRDFMSCCPPYWHQERFTDVVTPC